jgi:ankyrin repeat protein
MSLYDQALVRAGHDLNRLNKFGYSALQYAAADGRQDTVVKLLDLGADVHKTDRLKWTALHRAAGNGHTETVKVLVERGADVNAHDNQFYTALHEATWCGHVEVSFMAFDTPPPLLPGPSRGHMVLPPL